MKLFSSRLAHASLFTLVILGVLSFSFTPVAAQSAGEWTEKCYPDCKGKLTSECKDIILADDRGEELQIQVKGPYDMVTMDYRLDRVRITEDSETKRVIGLPCRG